LTVSSHGVSQTSKLETNSSKSNKKNSAKERIWKGSQCDRNGYVPEGMRCEGLCAIAAHDQVSPPPLRSFLSWALPPTQEAAAAAAATTTTTEQRERTQKD
jgi:hypothetical protein